ncbi:MAG: ATP-binding protein [Pseudomonadota bacterium]
MPEDPSKADKHVHYLQAELYGLLQQDPHTFEILAKGSLDGLWYWDLENPEHEWMSPEFWRLFGIDPATKEHRAAEWQDLIHPDDLKAATHNFERHCEDAAHPYDQVVRFRHADGHWVWVRCRGFAIRDSAGRPLRMLGAHNDLTAMKRAEEAARREALLASSTATELRQFAYAVSHDLKSPVNTLSMLLSELDGALEAGDAADAQLLLTKSRETSTRMRQLIDDLLDYTKVIGGRREYETVPLAGLANGLLDDLKADITASHGDVRIDPLPTVTGLPMQLRLLLQNLLTNALKFHQPDTPPRVQVSSRETAHGVEVTVRDWGIGIAPEYREQVFGLFQRLNNRTEFPGTGLGLALCRRVAQNHGGHVTIEAPPDAGTAFCVFLPTNPRPLALESAP